MFGRIKQIAWGALFGTLIATQALGQTATLLPNAKQQFFTPQGIPAAAGTVDMYIPSTTTRKTTWKSSSETTGNQNTNPVLLDAGGFAVIYGDGQYRQVVKDADGNTIWDAITASTGSGGGGGGTTPATGDGNLVGTILPWSGWSLPNQYLFADGHAVSRTTYPELLVALTHTVNVICTSGLPTLSGIPFNSTFNVPIGASVEASCIPPGSTVISKAANSLTMSSNATVSTAVSARIFFYGDGDRSTTFNLPDLRSTVVAGPDAMDTTVGARAVLIPPYFPQNGIGAATASPFTTLTLANLPPYTPAGTITNGAITNTVSGGVNGGTGVNTTVAAAGVQLLTGSTAIAVASAQATSTFLGTPVGSSAPVTVVQPTLMMNYIIKVTPDANSATATGVLSLGGMTGALACGTGLLCTGNTVALNGTPVSSSGSAAIGNIAFWLDTAATTLGSAPAFITANPGNAAIYSQLASPANGYTTTFNGMQYSQGTAIPAAEQYGSNVISLQQTLVATGVIAAGDVGLSNTLAGYCRTDAANPAICVGVFGQSGTSVNNANIFGMNSVVQNIQGPSTAGFNVNFISGMEINPNLWQISAGVNPTVNQNHFYGINIQGGGNHTNEIGSGILINNSAFPATTRWGIGLELANGCCIVGVSLGQASLGSNQASSTLQFLSKDAGGIARIGNIFSDANGSMYTLPAPNAAVIIGDGNGNTLAQFETTGVIGGNTGMKLPGVVAVGVLNTSITGVVSSSTTLPSGLTAPTFTVTGSFTATGLVTNADLVNAATTVNGQTCTLGSTCTITAAATTVAVGSTTITGGTTTRVLFDNAGVLGEYTISGTGNVAMTTNAVFTTPNLGTPSALVGTNVTGLPTTALTGTLQAAQEPAHTGDVTNTAGSLALTIAANAVTLAKLATQATNTVLGNATAGSAVPTALAVATCSTSSSALNWTTNTGFGCNTSINAATLGGATFAAPGAIGGGTPSTGAFTTLTASTSISSPTHTASGALTFQSNGTTFAGDITTGQQWYIGSTLAAPASGVQLTVSKNAAAPAPAPLAGTIADFIQVDGTASRLAIREFGAGAAGPAVIYYAAGGTAASPTQTLSATPIGVNFGFGYGSGAYQTGAGSGFQMMALENCSSTACGSDFEIITTTAGTAAQAVVAYFKQGFSVGSSTDPGAGKINAQLGFAAGGTAGITRTCTIAVGNVLTFTLGILTATSGVAGCV